MSKKLYSKSYVLRSHKKITSYKYKMILSNKTVFEGSLSRSDMEIIHRLYTAQGANISMKSLSREFPQYSFIDMQRILRLFGITKASSALAPHQLEEFTKEEATNYLLRIKENFLFKKVEEQRIKNHENQIKDLINKIEDLKLEAKSEKLILSGIDLNNIKAPNIIINNNNLSKDLVIYLSDLHIGSYVNSEGVYDNNYNKQEVERRLNKIYDFILKQANSLKSITIFNLGDAIDGMNGGTTRPDHTHKLPQNMSNKEMARIYIESVYNFIYKISMLNSNVSFISVGESNHGGDYEYASTLALKVMLEKINVKSIVSERSINYIDLNFATYIYLHGKDNLNQFKPFPLTLDLKTENFFNEYIIRNNLKNNKEIIVVKGDTHQSALTKGKFFDYKAVGSLFGSSNWIHANFGKTDWCCDYSIFENGYRMDGIINENK